eukprot:2418877-Rhodomonas_salina.3
MARVCPHSSARLAVAASAHLLTHCVRSYLVTVARCIFLSSSARSATLRPTSDSSDKRCPGFTPSRPMTWTTASRALLALASTKKAKKQSTARMDCSSFNGSDSSCPNTSASASPCMSPPDTRHSRQDMPSPRENSSATDLRLGRV